MKLTNLFPSFVLHYRHQVSAAHRLKLIFFLYLIILCSLTCGCNEILTVQNISQEEVEILSPSDHATLDKLPFTLAWIGIEEASHYRLQIFTPSIDQSERILVDSILTNQFYTDSISVDAIEWRVRAENSSYQSQYSSRKFTLEFPSITNDRITLIAPKEGAKQYDFNMLFSWNSLPNAEVYQVQIGKPNFEKLVVDSLVSSSKLTYKFDNAGQYQWRVRGENQTKFTPYTTQNFTIKIDTSLESEVIKLLAPADNLTFDDGNIRLTWEAIEKAKNYRVQVSTPNFENAEQFILDSLTNNTSVNHHFDDGKTYQWRVKAIDSFTETAYSFRTFKVQSILDLSNKTVPILAPVNNSKLKNPEVNLTWVAVEGATEYHVQIATPSFTHALQIVADSQISDTNLSQTLTASTTYEWRVKALNSSSETPYTTSKFSIE